MCPSCAARIGKFKRAPSQGQIFNGCSTCARCRPSSKLGKGPRTRRPHLSPPARPCWGSGRLPTLLRLGFVEGLDNSGLAGLSSLLPSPGDTRVWGGCKPQLYLSGSCWNLRDGPDSASYDPPQASYLSQINPEIKGGVHIRNCAREPLQGHPRPNASWLFLHWVSSVSMQPKPGPVRGRVFLYAVRVGCCLPRRPPLSSSVPCFGLRQEAWGASWGITLWAEGGHFAPA